MAGIYIGTDSDLIHGKEYTLNYFDDFAEFVIVLGEIYLRKDFLIMEEN